VNTALNATRREEELAALAGGEVVDVLVVGGGVTGAGIALDAAARGLSVALLEAHDLAFGTSRWSSKLVHGGLRYLAKGDVPLAHESAVERGILMTSTAPHLTRPLPQLIPLQGTVSRATAMFMGAGLRAGDALRRAARTPSALLPPPRRVSAPEALALAPGLRSADLRGGLLSFDGQLIDDARLVVALARTAAGFGAKIITRAPVTALTGTSAEVRDGDRLIEVRARTVVNATGVWAGKLVPSVRLRPSLGTHLVVSAEAAGLVGAALTVPIPGSRSRFVLLLPQADGLVYLGLTDEPYDGEIPDVPVAPPSDVDFLLDVASSVLARPLTAADVLGSYAGLRPLLEAPGRSADLSRKHAVLRSTDGVLTIVGGKLTTYRRMAEDAVDAAVAEGNLTAQPSTTRRLPLVGAAPRTRLSAIAAPTRLVSKYGTEAPAVARLDPTPIADGLPITAGEITWAIDKEGALTPEDILERRTRLSLVPTQAATAAPAITTLLTKHRESRAQTH
jgi:glycerol-3-phosphate dehydrogenase